MDLSNAILASGQKSLIEDEFAGKLTNSHLQMYPVGVRYSDSRQ
jgi:hypothetical protein